MAINQQRLVVVSRAVGAYCMAQDCTKSQTPDRLWLDCFFPHLNLPGQLLYKKVRQQNNALADSLHMPCFSEKFTNGVFPPPQLSGEGDL